MRLGWRVTKSDMIRMGEMYSMVTSLYPFSKFQLRDIIFQIRCLLMSTWKKKEAVIQAIRLILHTEKLHFLWRKIRFLSKNSNFLEKIISKQAHKRICNPKQVYFQKNILIFTKNKSEFWVLVSTKCTSWLWNGPASMSDSHIWVIAFQHNPGMMRMQTCDENAQK